MIYMGNDMVDLLAKSIQSEDSDYRVDLIPRYYCDKQLGCKYIILNNRTMIKILYYCVLICIPVKRPNSEEIDKC